MLLNQNKSFQAKAMQYTGTEEPHYDFCYHKFRVRLQISLKAIQSHLSWSVIDSGFPTPTNSIVIKLIKKGGNINKKKANEEKNNINLAFASRFHGRCHHA